MERERESEREKVKVKAAWRTKDTSGRKEPTTVVVY